MNIAINGFGRIGRQALRIICDKHPDMKVVLINDLSPNDILAHLLEWDTAYGHFDCGEIKYDDDSISGNFGTIKMTAIKDPAELPHKELNIDVVLECTGVFRTREGAQKHIDAGAKKVVISAPGKDEIDGTFVMGVNHETYEPSMNIISNASCTTNCLAPMAKVLNDSFGIQQGFMTTIHSVTSSQKIVDGPDKDWRRARSAMVNLIPTTTGAAKAVGLVLPELAGKLDGMAVRTPTLTGSLTDLTCVVDKDTTAEEVNAAFKKASEGSMKDILGYEERPLVLIDYVGDPRSSIIDALSTKVQKQGDVTLVKTLSWYDNEWGYSSRMVELAEFVGSKI